MSSFTKYKVVDKEEPEDEQVEKSIIGDHVLSLIGNVIKDEIGNTWIGYSLDEVKKEITIKDQEENRRQLERREQEIRETEDFINRIVNLINEESNTTLSIVNNIYYLCENYSDYAAVIYYGFVDTGLKNISNGSIKAYMEKTPPERHFDIVEKNTDDFC